MNNNNNITINNLNKTNFSYDNSEEQLQVGVKIILNAFENKIAFFEKEITNLKEALRLKEEKVVELEGFLENVSEDLKKCQEFNSNLLEENKYLVDLTEKLNEDNNKLAKFKNSILSSLHFDSNFILNQDYNGTNLNNSDNININNNNQFYNHNNDEYEKTRLSPTHYNPQNSLISNNTMPNYFSNKNSVSLNGKDQENNGYRNNKSSRNNVTNANINNSLYNYDKFSGVYLNTNSNMKSLVSPLNKNNNFNELFNPNLMDSGNHINDMIKNLQNKMKVNSNINKNLLNNQEKERKTNNNITNQNKKQKNKEDNKDYFSDGNSVGNERSSNISDKIFELKNKFKTQKFEKFNTADTLTTLNTQNSDGNSKKENIENAINIAKEKSGKSNKYQQSIKFFNEARVILKKEEFDELVFLIKSINQGKVNNEQFDTKINLLIGNHPSLIRDLSNVVNIPA